MGIVLDPQPQTAGQWRDQYPDTYVLVTRRDRKPSARSEPGQTLGTESIAALAGFPIVVSAAPPISRLSGALSRLGIATAKTDSVNRIDVYQVPPSKSANKVSGADADRAGADPD